MVLILSKLNFIDEVNDEWKCFNRTDKKLIDILFKLGKEKSDKIKFTFLFKFLTIYQEFKKNNLEFKTFRKTDHKNLFSFESSQN